MYKREYMRMKAIQQKLIEKQKEIKTQRDQYERRLHTCKIEIIEVKNENRSLQSDLIHIDRRLKALGTYVYGIQHPHDVTISDAPFNFPKDIRIRLIGSLHKLINSFENSIEKGGLEEEKIINATCVFVKIYNDAMNQNVVVSVHAGAHYCAAYAMPWDAIQRMGIDMEYLKYAIFEALHSYMKTNINKFQR